MTSISGLPRNRSRTDLCNSPYRLWLSSDLIDEDPDAEESTDSAADVSKAHYAKIASTAPGSQSYRIWTDLIRL